MARNHLRTNYKSALFQKATQLYYQHDMNYSHEWIVQNCTKSVMSMIDAAERAIVCFCEYFREIDGIKLDSTVQILAMYSSS